MVKFGIRIFRLFFALLAAGTIAFDLVDVGHNIVNYFSLFTILSNVVAICVFLYLAIAGTKNNSVVIDSVRGATTVCLLVSGAVYFLLLKDLPNASLPFVNTVLHQIMPAVFIADWLVLPPRKHLKLSESFKWLAFSVAYLGYVLVRGGIVNWYPYPFLNPTNNGYASVFIYSVVMAIAGLLLSTLIIILGNKLRSLTK